MLQLVVLLFLLSPVLAGMQVSRLFLAPAGCLLTLLIYLPSDLDSHSADTCFPRVFEGNSQKIACVCDSSRCGQLSFTWPQRSGEAYLVQSTRSGKRFSVSELDEYDTFQEGSNFDEVQVNLATKYQKILGWGGAFTDSALINIRSLPESLGDQLLESYYGPNGLQYNFGRVPMAGSDFSTRVYSYNDNPDNLNQTLWQLAEEDLTLKIPYLKKASELSQGGKIKLKLIGTPWSPPAWMKTNQNAVRGKLIDDDRVYQSYAEYWVKFFDVYEHYGLNFWGASVQNEPVASNLFFYTFNSLQLSAKEAIKFITGYLGPALERRGKTKKNFKLMVGDDSLGLVNSHAVSVLRDEQVQKYVSGLAIHWYTSGVVPYAALSNLYEKVANKIEFMMMTEACTGAPPAWRHVDPGSWDRGVSYAKDIVEDLLRHTGAWIDWNLALDMQGGPNWAKNYVDSPILVDSQKGEFYKQPMYYSLAHFSRFFRPNSVRVDADVRAKKSGLKSIAALTKDSKYVVVYLLNDSNRDRKISLGVIDESGENQQRKFVIESHSFNTIVLKR